MILVVKFRESLQLLDILHYYPRIPFLSKTCITIGYTHIFYIYFNRDTEIYRHDGLVFRTVEIREHRQESSS